MSSPVGSSRRAPGILSRNDLPDYQQHFADEIGTQYNGDLVGPWIMWLHSPDLASRVANTGKYIRFATTLPKYVYKIAVLTALVAADVHYAWAVHAPSAGEYGVSDETVAAIKNKTAPAGLP